MEHMLGLNLQVLMNIVRKQKNHHSINTLYCNKLARRNIRCLQLGKFGPQSFIYKRNHSRDVVALGQGILITCTPMVNDYRYNAAHPQPKCHIKSVLCAKIVFPFSEYQRKNSLIFLPQNVQYYRQTQLSFGPPLE